MENHEKDMIEIKDLHEVIGSDISSISESIYEILESVYRGPFKNISVADVKEAKNHGEKLGFAGIPLQYYDIPSILEKNGVDRSTKIFYHDNIPAGIITYKLNLQKEKKYVDMLEKNNFRVKNGYIELKSFFVFFEHQHKGLGTYMMKKMYDFFVYGLGKGDGVLVTVNKQKLGYAYDFFISHGFVDIGSEMNNKSDMYGEKSEHVLYYPQGYIRK